MDSLACSTRRAQLAILYPQSKLVIRVTEGNLTFVDLGVCDVLPFIHGDEPFVPPPPAATL